MILDKIGYSYNDLTIVPALISNISSRSECNPYIDDNYNLPLFTAPMSSVINEKNIDLWKSYGISPILPRTININTRIKYVCKEYWIAVSINEFTKYFIDGKIKNYCDIQGKKFYVCIDIANGHMKSLYDKVSKGKKIAKSNKYDLVIMTGNIANPKTYAYLCNSDVDYVRLSIGSGNGCLTTSNTSIHYPIATLIDECHKIRTSRTTHISKNYPKIIADGGIRNYSDVIKALALGADYVMIGSVFSGFLESSAELFVKTKIDIYSEGISYLSAMLENEKDLYSNSIEVEEKKREFIKNYELYKKFYGMSTKKAQLEIAHANNDLDIKMKTSEGIEKMIPCKYTIKQWVDNFISYLKSAMSYTDSPTLEHFKVYTDLIINSSNEINSVNK